MAQGEFKQFNGLLFPIYNKGTGDKGMMMGAVVRELFKSPTRINLNYALITREKAESSAGLVWFYISTPKGAYTNDACCYWTIQALKKEQYTRGLVARIKPNSGYNSSDASQSDQWDYHTIFWERGNPVKIGQQHAVGRLFEKSLKDPLISFIRSFEKEEIEYQIKNENIQDLGNQFQTVLINTGLLEEGPPLNKLNTLKTELQIQRRDATWPYNRALLNDFL